MPPSGSLGPICEDTTCPSTHTFFMNDSWVAVDRIALKGQTLTLDLYIAINVMFI